MRPLSIDFKRRTATGRWLLLIVGVAILALAMREGWLLLELRSQSAKALAELQQARASIAQIAARASSVAVPAYAADAARIRTIATRDLAGVLAALEGIRHPGVKVRSLEWDASTGVAQAELEVQDMAQLLVCVKSLNEGEPTPRWSIIKAAYNGDAAGGVVAIISGRW